MRKQSFITIILAVLAFVFVSCSKEKDTITHINYADTNYWYSIGDENHEADVFYVYPTVATISYAENDSSWYTDITLPEVREEANGNQKFNKLLYYEYNFYAPYYRQMIFDAYRQSEDILERIAQTPIADIKDAFQYYMAHYNHGRPFFLVGHSQGSQMLIELLKNGMTKKQRQQMVAAYCIGFQITDQELAQYPEALKPAVDSCMVEGHGTDARKHRRYRCCHLHAPHHLEGLRPRRRFQRPAHRQPRLEETLSRRRARRRLHGQN